MPIPDLWQMLGYQNNATMFMEAFNGVSNTILTDNPQFTKDDFTSIFHVFPISDTFDPENPSIPTPFFELVLVMADKAIKYDRYKGQWKYLMCLYLAHYFTLFLQTQKGDADAQSALQGALPTGVATSKSVDGLSISYDLMGMTDDLQGYGTWKLTAYGQQLVTLTKIYGHAGMWVNG